MTIASAIITTAAEGGHDPLAVMMSTFPAFIIAIAIFGVLALVVASYRNVANRHAPKAEKFAARHGGDAHGSGH